MVQGNRRTIENSYFYKTAGRTSVSYGVESLPAADTLVQNNIFQFITAPISLNGACSGCVLAYNYDIDDVFDTGGGTFLYQMHGVLAHAVGVENIPVEGNQGAGLDSDIIHGTPWHSPFHNGISQCL
jgi:hypothetical protein